MYAIIETGGKQYKVAEGDTLRVELLDAEIDDKVEIDRVLAIVDDGKINAGNPLVENAKVVLKVVDHGKGKKIMVLRYRAKKNIRKKRGHRQPFTKVQVEKIMA